MKIFGIILFLFSLFISGCASKQRVVAPKQELPSWYVHPPRSDTNELFSLGEGENRQDAINNALSLLASTLNVSIASNFQAKTVVKEGSVNSSDATYINNTQSNVKKIVISEYEILHGKKLGFERYAVVIKVNKEKLFQGLKSQIDQKFEIYKSDSKNLSSLGALKQLAYYKNIKKSFDYIKNALIVMKVLKKSFSDEKYMVMINEINTKQQYLLEHISFWVISNVKNLSKPVISALTKQKFIIKNQKSKMHFTIYINAKIQKANAYGFFLARSEISLITKNYKGEFLASNILHVTGQSSLSYAIAKQNLVKRFNDLIQKEGLSKILNI